MSKVFALVAALLMAAAPQQAAAAQMKASLWTSNCGGDPTNLYEAYEWNSWTYNTCHSYNINGVIQDVYSVKTITLPAGCEGRTQIEMFLTDTNCNGNNYEVLGVVQGSCSHRSNGGSFRSWKVTCGYQG